MVNQQREQEIANIIENYSNKEMVDREWLENCYSDDNQFRNSFCDIKKTLGDFDLALWYIAYGQSFGKRTDFMHEKMADTIMKGEIDILSFKKDLPNECPFSSHKEHIMKSIFNLDYNRHIEDIRSDIYRIFRSEKFYGSNKWCNYSSFQKCSLKEQCPLASWINLLEEMKFPLVFEKKRINSRAFFYFDTLVLINNYKTKRISDLFSIFSRIINENSKQTIILRSLFEQVRGMKIKIPFFFQKENQFNYHSFDESELIYVDTRAIRVATRIMLPNSETGIIPAIKKISNKYSLTANQIDTALYEMGDVCSEKDGCKHGIGQLSCVFYPICNYQNKRKV